MKATLLFFLSLCAAVSAQPLARADWGAPLVKVSPAQGQWTIAGRKQKVTIDTLTFALAVNAQSVVWKMSPSGTNDLTVKYHGQEFALGLTAANEISIEPYDTGFKTGVKITLGQFRHNADILDLKLHLTVCLEGRDEDLVFDIAAQERDTILRRLDWPTTLDARDVDDTVLSNNKGNLLPRNWPKLYYPIRSTDPNMGTGLCFFENGNYVTLAKRYRQYVMDTGLFVSLKEKIAKKPIVAEMLGLPQTRVGILHNQSTNSDRYSPTNHFELFTFDQRAQQLRDLKAAGIDKTLVFISGWAHLGYDRQHPDSLPPPEAAGGWDGMKRLADTCHELGYPFIFHDQYRDYYTDAPSFNPDFAIHEETINPPAIAFAGSRFGDWKEGQIPFMRHWDGGPQSYLNSRFQLGHLEKNYQLMFDHGVHPDGIYIDVIGYVPPDEDFNPSHPTTRMEAMRGQTDLMNWAGHHLGVTATEAGADWVIPFSDIVNQSGGLGRTIPIPLYQLVYHDALLVSYGEARRGGHNQLLLGCLCGGVPELPVNLNAVSKDSLDLIKKMAALNKRVGLLEMTNHEFLDAARKKERSTFADGTTVTVDWDAQAVKIEPDLPR